MSSACVLLSLALITGYLELAFAEIHGGKKRHFHHRSELVDGRVRHPDGTITPEKEPSIVSMEEDRMREEEKKAFLQCLLLEMGILFHSVFIGALSRSVGPSQ